MEKYGMTFAQKLKHELQEYLSLSAYLYVCFVALVLYKATILGGAGVSYLPYGLPAIKALILAKFILLGHAVGLGDRFGMSRVVHVIVAKALLYLALLIVLSVVEEAVAGIIHGRSIAASLSEIGGGSLPQILVTNLIMLLILIPYLASRELDIALGEGRLWEILFGQGVGPHSGRP
jgi:hypothetical protein